MNYLSSNLIVINEINLFSTLSAIFFNKTVAFFAAGFGYAALADGGCWYFGYAARNFVQLATTTCCWMPNPSAMISIRSAPRASPAVISLRKQTLLVGSKKKKNEWWWLSNFDSILSCYSILFSLNSI